MSSPSLVCWTRDVDDVCTWGVAEDRNCGQGRRGRAQGTDDQGDGERDFLAGSRSSGGRIGLSRPVASEKFGMVRLTTIGRRSGQPRVAMVGYLEDGPNLVTLAMNGWAEAEPAWWLSLQAQPNTTVEMKDGARAVRARAANGEEGERLWAGWGEFNDDYDAWAAMRSDKTAVVVLEPRAA